MRIGGCLLTERNLAYSDRSYWGEVFSCVYSGEFGEVIELFRTLAANIEFFLNFIFYQMERKTSVYIVQAGSVLV